MNPPRTTISLLSVFFLLPSMFWTSCETQPDHSGQGASLEEAVATPIDSSIYFVLGTDSTRMVRNDRGTDEVRYEAEGQKTVKVPPYLTLFDDDFGSIMDTTLERVDTIRVAGEVRKVTPAGFAEAFEAEMQVVGPEGQYEIWQQRFQIHCKKGDCLWVWNEYPISDIARSEMATVDQGDYVALKDMWTISPSGDSIIFHPQLCWQIVE